MSGSTKDSLAVKGDDRERDWSIALGDLFLLQIWHEQRQNDT